MKAMRTDERTRPATKKEKRKDEVELNTASVLAEIERLGEGLVSAIEVLR